MIKRAPTPLTQVNNISSLIQNTNRNNLSTNIQITGIRFTNDETSSSKFQ